MRWKDREESSNIEDKRGMSGGAKAGLGGAGLILVIVFSLITRQNPLEVISQVNSGQPDSNHAYQPSAKEESLRKFTAVILKDTETTWNEAFRSIGRDYKEPVLVMFTGQVKSGCGVADAGMGPFYCGEDEKVYIDLSFYQLLKDRFGSKGDFAQAYVIAHEVGHHVQKQLGTLDKVHAMQSRLSPKDYNALSVRLELQADYYAGVWAKQAREMASLDENDLRSALEVAKAIGDDAIQTQAQGYVVPDAFTHGTSEQRARWFLKGWESGDFRRGDTFSVRNP